MKRYDIVWVDVDKTYYVIEHEGNMDSDTLDNYAEGLKGCKRTLPLSLAGMHAMGRDDLEEVIQHVGKCVVEDKPLIKINRKMKLNQIENEI